MDPNKNGFLFWGDRPPFGGDMGFGRFAFGPLFLEIRSTDFVILSLIDSTYSLQTILSLKKI